MSPDNGVLSFKHYIISDNDRVTRELDFLRQVQSIRQIGAFERSGFMP